MPIPQPKPDRVVIADIRPPIIWDDGLYVLVDGGCLPCIDEAAHGAVWVAGNDDALAWYRLEDGWALLWNEDFGCFPWVERASSIFADAGAWLRVEMRDGKARVVTPDGRALAIHVPVELECFV